MTTHLIISYLPNISQLSIPTSCSARVLRWALKLSQFDYEFVYSKGADNVLSDCLSRMSLPTDVIEAEPYELVFVVDAFDTKIISHETIKQHVEADDNFTIKSYIKEGCPRKILNPFLAKIKNQIPYMTIYKNCILYQDRVFIPPALRQSVLSKFHEHHPGMVPMKSLARALIWYPGMDKDIEQLSLSHTCSDRNRRRTLRRLRSDQNRRAMRTLHETLQTGTGTFNVVK